MTDENYEKHLEKYHTLFSAMDEGYCIIQMLYDSNQKPVDWIFVEVNPAFEKHNGLTDATGKTMKHIAPDIEQKWMDIYGKVADTGKSIRFTEDSDALGRVFDLYAFRVGDPSEKKVAVLFTDITERRRHESNLVFLADISRELDHLTTVRESMHQLGAKIAGEFKLSRCLFAEVFEDEDRVTIMSDWHRPEFSSMMGEVKLSQFVSEEYRELSRKGEPVVVDDVYKSTLVDGRQLKDHFQIAAFVNIPLLKEGKWRFLLGIYDVVPRHWREDELELLQELTTRIWIRLERARTEETLKQANERFRLAEAASNGFIYDWQIDTNTVNRTDGFYRLLGYKKGEIPKHENAWRKLIHPDDLEGVAITPENLPKTDNFVAEYRVRQKNGDYIYMLDRGMAVRDDEGKIVRIVGSAVNITESKNTERLRRDFTAALEQEVSQRTSELKQSQDELLETNKQLQGTIAQLESFNHIASHDLQEPLRKIQIFGSRLVGDISIEKKAEYLSAIETASTRMRELIDDLLVFSRLGQKSLASFKPTNLNEILDIVKSEYEIPIHEKRASIESGPLPTVNAIQFQMRQLFANLISNSLKFSERKPVIRISCATVSGKELRSQLAQARDRNYFEIIFADNGIGFDNDYREKIFGLFQRLPTPEKFRGTGIGLSIVEKVVKDHNGFVTASGEKGKGATFTVYLPA